MIALVVFYHLSSYAQSQHFLSEMWTGSGGNGALFYKNSIGSGQNQMCHLCVGLFCLIVCGLLSGQIGLHPTGGRTGRQYPGS